MVYLILPKKRYPYILVSYQAVDTGTCAAIGCKTITTIGDCENAANQLGYTIDQNYKNGWISNERFWKNGCWRSNGNQAIFLNNHGQSDDNYDASYAKGLCKCFNNFESGMISV